MPVPGEMVGDRYRLDDRIAAGGMGEVWQATDTVLGRDVAVKTLQTNRAGDPGFQTRFRHEARAMAVLHHPNVADVFDYGESGSDAYIVMARVDGQPLNQRIAERGRLTAAETLSIIVQAGRALDAAHRAGIVHRDVKPGNLIIQPDDTVVLVDFGVARSAESSTLTGAKEVVGTALYIAPEQVSKQVTGPPADIYALGAVAYHCLAGHPPFLGDNPITVAMHHLNDDPPPLPDDVPKPVQALVATAMAKDPAKRFPSAAAMAAAATSIDSAAGDTAAAVTTHSPHDTRPAGTAVRPASAGDAAVLPAAQPTTERRRGALLAGVLGLLTLAAVAAVLAFVNPGGLLPGGPNPSTAVPGSADPGGAPAPPGADATDDGGATDNRSGNGGESANTTRPDASPARTLRPTQPAGAPATSATPSGNTTSSRRPSATATGTTSTPSPEGTTAGTTRQTTSAPARETTAAATAASGRP